MTMATLNTAVVWPNMMAGDLPAIANDVTLDAAGEYVAYVFMARQAMTISHVGWRTGTVTGTCTADTRIETVAADGTPSGTLWATNTNIVSGTLVATTWTLHALTASASIAAGQLFAIKILVSSLGTLFVVTNTSNMNGTNVQSNLPYHVTNTSGAAVKSRIVNVCKSLALGSSTTSFYSLPQMAPATAVTVSAFNNTNSAARGLRFQVPVKCRCVGIRTWASTSVGDFNIVLYNDAGTELSSSSTTLDGDHTAAVANAYIAAFFDSPVTLDANTWYRAVVEPSSATNTTLAFITLPGADYRSAWPHGTNAHYTTRASGSWTDSATDQLPVIELLLDQFDDGTGTGAGLKIAGRGGLAG